MALKKAPKGRDVVYVTDSDNNTVRCNFEEAQKKVNDGWSVQMNKTGKKLAKQSTPKPKRAKKKVEGK